VSPYVTVPEPVARVVPSLLLDRGFAADLDAHWSIGVRTLAGQNVYIDPLGQDRYPYPPLHRYVSALMVLLSGHDRAVFIVVDKLVPALCGVGVALAARAIALRLGSSPDRALAVGLLYGLNPLPVLVTAYQGQIDEIPLLGITVALLLLVNARHTLGTVSLSALMLGVAADLKTWPLLFLPPLVLAVRRPVYRLLYIPLAVAPLLMSLLLYQWQFPYGGQEAMLHMTAYHGAAGMCWGLATVVSPCWVFPDVARPNGWFLAASGKLLPVALSVACALVVWRRRPLEGMVVLPLTLYLFTPNWGPNYSIWVLPFAALLRTRFLVGYTLVALPVIALTYIDLLYALDARPDLFFDVLRPIEGALGLLAWCGIISVVAWLLHDAAIERRVAHEAAPSSS